MVSGPRPFTGLWADAETGSGLTHSFPQAASHIPMGVAAAELHGPSLAPTWLCHTATHELVLRRTAHHQGAAEADGAHLHPHTVTAAQSSGRAAGRPPPPPASPRKQSHRTARVPVPVWTRVWGGAFQPRRSAARGAWMGKQSHRLEPSSRGGRDGCTLSRSPLAGARSGQRSLLTLGPRNSQNTCNPTAAWLPEGSLEGLL